MSASFISIANLKGGIGETIISTMLVVGLSELGHKVVLADLNLQAVATAVFFNEFTFKNI